MSEEETSLGALLLKLGIDAAEFLVGLKAGEEAAAVTAKKIEASTVAMGESFGRLKETAIEFAAVMGIGIGVEAFKSFIENSMEGIEKMVLLSDRLNISTTDMYALKKVCEDTGTDLDVLTGGIGRMDKAIESAQEPGSKMAHIFAMIGANAEELKKKSPEEALLSVAKGVSSLTDMYEKNEAEQALFGRSGAQLSNTLKSLADGGLEEAREKAAALGDTVTRFDAAKVQLAVEAFKNLKDIVEGIGITLSVALAPYLKKIVDDFVSSKDAAGNLKETVKNFVDDALTGFAYVGNALQVLKIIWDGLVLVVAELENAIMQTAAQFTVVFVAMGQLAKNFGTLVKAEWDGIGAVGQLTWLKIEEVYGKFLQSTIVGLANLIDTIGKSLPDAMAATKGEMSVAATVLTANFGNIGTEATKAFNKASEAAEQTKLKIADAFNGLVPTIDDVMNNKAVKSTQEWAKTTTNAVQVATDKLKEDMAKPWTTETSRVWREQAIADIDAVAAEKTKGAGGDEAGTQSGGNAAMSAYKAGLQAKIDEHKQYLNADLLLETQNYNKEVNAMKDAFAVQHTDQATQDAILEDMKEKHEANLNNIESKAAKANVLIWESGLQGKLKITGEVLGDISALTASKNKEMFEVGKAASYANTIVHTAEAAMGAYDAYASIPYVGPVLGAAAAAAAIAAGAIQLATISSTSIGGGGSPSSAGFSPSGPSAPTGASTGGVQGGARDTSNVSFIVAPGIYSSNDMRSFIKQYDRARSDGTISGGR